MIHMTAVAFAQQEFSFPPAPVPRLEPVVSLVPPLSSAPASTPRLNVPVVRHGSQPRHLTHRSPSVHLVTSHRAVWLLRGVLAAVVAVLAVTGLLVAAGDDAGTVSVAPTAVVASSAVDGSDPAGAPTADLTAVHVVQPGDTLWSIAATVAPGSDPRPIVDELARRSGGAGLQPGQRIALEGLVR
jgi:hypothetical protein